MSFIRHGMNPESLTVGVDGDGVYFSHGVKLHSGINEQDFRNLVAQSAQYGHSDRTIVVGDIMVEEQCIDDEFKIVFSIISKDVHIPMWAVTWFTIKYSVLLNL